MPRQRGRSFEGPESIAGLRGFVGVDFIWDPERRHATLLEINPRPTTSIVGSESALARGLSGLGTGSKRVYRRSEARADISTAWQPLFMDRSPLSFDAE